MRQLELHSPAHLLCGRCRQRRQSKFFLRARVAERRSQIAGTRTDYGESVEKFDYAGRCTQRGARSFCSGWRAFTYHRSGWLKAELIGHGPSLVIVCQQIPGRPELLQLWWHTSAQPNGEKYSILSRAALHTYHCDHRVATTQEWQDGLACTRRVECTYNAAGLLIRKKENTLAVPGSIQWDLMAEAGPLPFEDDMHYTYRGSMLDSSISLRHFMVEPFRQRVVTTHDTKGLPKKSFIRKQSSFIPAAIADNAF